MRGKYVVVATMVSHSHDEIGTVTYITNADSSAEAIGKAINVWKDEYHEYNLMTKPVVINMTEEVTRDKS